MLNLWSRDIFRAQQNSKQTLSCGLPLSTRNMAETNYHLDDDLDFVLDIIDEDDSFENETEEITSNVSIFMP